MDSNKKSKNTDVPNNLIINGNKIIEKFGQWMSFHDWEVLRVLMDRKGPFIEMDIRGWNMLNETDEKGRYKITNESIITLRFNDINDVVLEGFNHQNVLMSLTFQEEGGFLKTTLSTNFGLYGYLVSKTMEVVKIEDYVQ